ncbi:MAG: aldo/keto reductase [Cyanobacteria bacterium J06600_6]
MLTREFGQSGIKLSPVTFGTMRVDPQQINLDAALALITYLYEHGVNTFHSSHEYDTDSFFCDVLSKFHQQNPSAEIKHIAKIGVPHFGEGDFKSDRLIALVENRLRDLNTERLDLVQWLVRHQPNEDQYRLPILADCQSELETTWSKLQQQGKVGALTSFPYSSSFAEAVLRFPTCQGLVTYLNLMETEMASLLSQMSERGQGYVAIRPLCGGLLTGDHARNTDAPESEQIQKILAALNISPTYLTKLAIQFPLLHPVVTSVMVSVSSIDHAQEVISAVNELEASDQHRFNQILKAIA